MLQLTGHINNFNFVTFWHEPTIAGAFYKNVHVFSAGQLDRSPGGTGTSAMMAMFEGARRASRPLAVCYRITIVMQL